tara:strand:- start:327 stop:593 length:267 start_codon:yes stop_codon:yes gene_type:complete
MGNKLYERKAIEYLGTVDKANTNQVADYVNSHTTHGVKPNEMGGILQRSQHVVDLERELVGQFGGISAGTQRVGTWRLKSLDEIQIEP